MRFGALHRRFRSERKCDWDLGNEAIRTADQNASEKKKARVAAVKSIVLFESGKREEGLAAARKAVEQAGSESERAAYERCVRIMENRIK